MKEIKRMEKTRNSMTALFIAGITMFVVALTTGFFSQMNTTTFVLFLISAGICVINICSAYYLAIRLRNMESEYYKDARGELFKELNKLNK